MLKVAGDLRRPPAKFENPAKGKKEDTPEFPLPNLRAFYLYRNSRYLFNWQLFTEVEVDSGGHLPSREAARLISTTFTDTEVNNCFSIYHTSWITSGPKSNFICDNYKDESHFVFRRLFGGE